MCIRAARYSFGLTVGAGKPRLLAYMLIEAAGAALPLLGTYLLAALLDLVVSSSSPRRLYFYADAYLMTLTARLALSSVKAVFKNALLERARFRFDSDIREKLARLPLSFIDSSEGRNTLDYVRSQGVSAVHVIYYFTNSLIYLYTFVLAFIPLVGFEPLYSVLFVLLTLPAIIWNVISDRMGDEFARRTAPDKRKFSYYRWMLTDPYTAGDVRTYDLTEDIRARYDEEHEVYRSSARRLDRKRFGISGVIGLLDNLALLAFTALVVIRAASGGLTVGEVGLYVGLATSVVGTFKQGAGELAILFTHMLVRIERVIDFLELETPEERAAVRKLGEFESLEFDRVCFGYPGSEKHVLNGVSFRLERGERLALVGVNGAGKSTLVKLMLGLYEPESGSILLNGHPLGEYSIDSVRSVFSVLFQDFVKYPLTLRESVALSDISRLAEDESVIDALKLAGAWELFEKRENDVLGTYMTRRIDDDGIELSRGQWQKLALARAYFKRAGVFVFDEPSAALDALAEDAIFESFAGLSRELGGIMISHRISAARLADRIIVLDSGVIAESGTHDELLAKAGIYAELYSRQRERYTGGEAV